MRTIQNISRWGKCCHYVCNPTLSLRQYGSGWGCNYEEAWDYHEFFITNDLALMHPYTLSDMLLCPFQALTQNSKGECPYAIY